MRKVMMVLVAAACTVAVGCTLPPRLMNALHPGTDEMKITSQFEADKAREMSQEKGNNTIKGSALMRQDGGCIVTCAGDTVDLIPATAYANERMQITCGSILRGFLDARSMRQTIKFSLDPPEYMVFRRKSTCDALGFFKFEEVPDGEYFLTTAITWSVGSSTQGGFLMLRVEVKGGKTIEVVLAP